MATPLTADERKQRQFDLLWNTMQDNELLPYSAVQSLNKQLTTDNKSAIKAINELLTKLKINDTTVVNFSENFNSLVGNPELDTVDWDNLKLIDTNVIKSIYKLYLRIIDLEADSSGGILSYNTLSELQTAYPNGTNQPVWIISENSWYHWSGTVTPPADTTAPVLTITAGGNFTTTQSVTMSTNETATIYYTVDGSTPTTASTVYSSALSLSATTTVKAFAKDTAGNSSTVQTVTYTKSASDTTAPIVTASPAGGTYTTVQNVTLSANETATIYYTLDGTDPTVYSSVYSSPLSINETKSLKYFAKDTAGNSSTVQTQSYTINLADTTAPVLTITPAATFTNTQTVTMTTNETATIYYTLDDSDPKVSGTKSTYTAPLTLTETDTVKAYAKDTANNESTVQTVTYTKDTSTIYVSDNFNKSDSAASLGSGWTVSGGTWGISSNQAYLVTGGSSDVVAYMEANQADNIAIEVDMPIIVNGQSRITWRVQDNDHYFVIQPTNATTSAIYRRIGAGSWATINSSVTAAITNGTKIRVELTGSTHKVYVNGSLVSTFTDTNYQTATKHGIGLLGSNVARFDNFAVKSLT
jgi:hypothetical protein